MAATYSAIPVQDIAANQNVLFDNDSPCTKGYVIHQAGSGVFTLRGVTQQSCAKYRVTFNGNFTTSAGTGQIMLALTLNGEPLLDAVTMAYPAAADNYFTAHIDKIISIPCGCCFSVAIRNTGTLETAVTNANLIIERVC